MRPLARPARGLLAAVLAALPVVAALPPAPADASGSHALIQGSGSSWSSNAVNQWVADVQPSGLQVVFTPSGSAQGRKDFAYRTTDFAVSDIGYLGHDPVTNTEDDNQGRDFAYLPIVAGGTAFPYQVRQAGKLVRNIRLTGATLTKIFTLQITYWDDKQISADNNNRVLPHLKIIPVVHSEGSGSTAQFTRYMDTTQSATWRPFFGGAGSTEYYPSKSGLIAQNGSDGVMNFISSASANGAIGYDEYSYALAKNYPVVKLGNAAGYYTAPTQYNVAVALTRAKINTDQDPSHCAALGFNTSPCYLLQKLDDVYTTPDKRAYAMSSYSYMLIPTAANDQRMTTAKRQTIADFMNYSVCEGQAEMGPIGYSPLPINLAQAAFDQLAKLHTADSSVDTSHAAVTSCHNPTFDPAHPKQNHLAEIAPEPPACDRQGAGPCGDGVGTVNGNPTSSGRAPVPVGSGGATSGGPAGASSGSVPGLGGLTGVPTGAASTGAGSAPVIDPSTGQAVASNGDVPANLATVPANLSASQGSTSVLGVVAVLLLLGILLGPALLTSRLQR